MNIPKEDIVNPKFYDDPRYQNQSMIIGEVKRRITANECPHCTEWMSGGQVFCGWCLAKDMKFSGWDNYGLLWN